MKNVIDRSFSRQFEFVDLFAYWVQNLKGTKNFAFNFQFYLVLMYLLFNQILLLKT